MKHAAFHQLEGADPEMIGKRLQRIELTCWPLPGEPPRRLHPLGQIVTSDDGDVLIQPYRDRDGEHMWREGDRLAFVCYKCRHDGRAINGSVRLTSVLTLCAWLAFTENPAGVLAIRNQRWVPARHDDLATEVRRLADTSPYNLGRDEVLSYRHQLFANAGLSR